MSGTGTVCQLSTVQQQLGKSQSSCTVESSETVMEGTGVSAARSGCRMEESVGAEEELSIGKDMQHVSSSCVCSCNGSEQVTTKLHSGIV
jgi:hypothetical protein